jgi:putative ABC transport system permease protein
MRPPGARRASIPPSRCARNEIPVTALARAARSLARTPGPTLAAVSALALGIGAATAIFSVADAVVLRPLPYADADRLVAIEGQFLSLGMRDLGASPPELADYRARARSFDAIAAFSRSDLNLSGGTEAERVAAVRVTPDLLPLVGAHPALGQSFSPAEGPGADGVAILSHGLWQRRFGADPSVVGRTIALDGRAHAVVGVMPPGFRFPPPGTRFGGAAEVFVPLRFSKEETTARSQYSLAVIARRRAEVSVAAANAEMAAVARGLEAEYPESYRGPGGKDGGWRVTVAPLQDAVVGGAGSGVAVLFAAVLTLLLIACVDVAHVLLARGLARRRSVAVRMALGASRGRLVLEVLLESLVVALAGGALGALLAVWGTSLLAASGADIPRLGEASVDARALLFAVTAAMIAALLGGVGPAWQVTRGNVTDALGDGGRGASPGRASVRARRVLVVSELALAVLLVAGAGLFVRSLQRLQAVSPGFTKEGVLTAAVTPAGVADDRTRRLALFDRIHTDVAALPGVRVAALASRLPLTGPGRGGPFSVEGRPFDPTSAVPTFAVYRAVSPEYHLALQVPVRRGRGLSAQDAAGAPTVAVINETLARGFFGGGDPIGQRIKLGAPGSPQPWLTVVGISADVHDRALALPASPEIAVPLAQDPPESVAIVARTAGDPIALVPQLRAVVRAADPTLPVTEVRSLDRIVADSMAGRRSPALLLAGFALLAVILAGLGTYGVMSYAVSGRAHEMGVRMALGARPGDVAGLVVGEGLVLALAGAALGLVGAVAAGRALSSLLFEVRPADPLTFTASAAALVAVAAAACARPALRAARVDPAVALREE